MKPYIKIDKDIGLHLARPELAPAIFETVDTQRDYLSQWLPWVGPTRQLSDTERFIEQSMQHNKDGTRLTTFILKGEKLAGSLSVVTFNKECKSCEIGYWLRQELQGQGIMTRACQAFISHLFNSKSLHRIEIKVATANYKSQAVPLRLGFTREGVLRQALLLYGQYHDVVLFSLLRHEWENQKEGPLL